MPTYVYKCQDCDTKYDVFHKTIEEKDDAKCPSCNSENSKKLIAATNFSGFSVGKSFDMPAQPSCGCSSGMCGLN
jgi:putative FmdB family regulatory protein